MEIIILAVVVLVLTITVVAQNLQVRKLTVKLAATQGQTKPIHVTEPTAAELEAKLKAAYEAKIVEATATFGEDLKATSGRLSEQVSRLTTNVIEEELEAYQKTLEGVRQTATEAMEKIRQAVEEQRVELRKSMEADFASEKERLAAKFDTKLGDIVASYISESLGGGVDLGAQLQYVVNSLEEHKAELKKDLTSGV
jgi:hypothetical protein